MVVRRFAPNVFYAMLVSGRKMSESEGDPTSHSHGTHWSTELLQFMRDCCMSTNLLTGGASCTNKLAKLDRFVRRTVDNTATLTYGPGTTVTANSEFRHATAAEARDMLMRAEAMTAFAGSATSRAQPTSAERDFRDLGLNSDFVRHGNMYRRNYASNRSFAMESAKERLKEVDSRIRALQHTVAQCADLPRIRWR